MEVKKIYLSPSSQWGNTYSYKTYNEAQVCGMIARHAAVAIERNGFKAFVGDNVNKGMADRIKESNEWNADIHEPIHSNAFNGKAEGTVVFASTKNAKHHHVIAVYNEVAKVSPGKDRGIKINDGLYEIANANCPTVYVEVEFHDHPNHSKWIVENVMEIGEAIAKGHCEAEGKEYIGPEDKNADAMAIIEEMYIIQLGRKADPAGLKFWTDLLMSEEMTIDQIENALIDSEEGKRRFITELYVFLLDRQPDEQGMKDWMNALSNGVSRTEVYNAFVNSAEYKKLNN